MYVFTTIYVMLLVLSSTLTVIFYTNLSINELVYTQHTFLLI